MAISVISVSPDSPEESVRTPAGRVMAISVISVSPDSPEESVRTPAGRRYLLSYLLPTVPPSPDHTPALPYIIPASPDYSPISDTEFDPSKDLSSDHIPSLPAILPFLSSDDDTTDGDTPDTPRSPTHGTPLTKITPSTQRSPVVPRHRVMILAPGQPIPYRLPYWYHLNGPLHMLTARNRVGPLPTHRLDVRPSVVHSLLDYFLPDDSARDSSSDSSSKASSDFHSDASFDSSSRHSLPDHSSPDLPSISAGTSRKRRRFPMISVPALSHASRALSPVRVDLIPSPKRVRNSDYLANVEVDSKESSEPPRSRRTDVGVDHVIERVDESHSEHEIDLIQVTIKACFDFADIIRSRRIYVRVVIETVARDEIMMDTRDIVEGRDYRVTHPVVSEDVQEVAQEERSSEGTYETLGSLGRMIVGVESALTALTERIAELERDNRRLRGTATVKGQRVDRLWRGMSSKEMEAREVAMNFKPMNESGDEQEGHNGGNGNGGNGGNGYRGNGGNRNRENGNGNRGNRNGGSNINGNINGNHGMNYGETVFNISNCPSKYQVKYATYTLQDSTLTWWNSRKRTIGVDVAYAMKWVGLMKLMTEVMVPDEEDRVKRFIKGLPDNIQGNVIAVNPARLKDAIRIANQLMDKKLQGYAARSAKIRGGWKVTQGITMDKNRHSRSKMLVGPCTVKCNNCKRVGHQKRDYRSAVVVPNMQRALFGNQQGVICNECGRPGHVKRDCPKLRNQNHGSRVRNKTRNKTSNNEATTIAYAIGRGGANLIPTSSQVLKMVDLIYVLGVDSHQLRMKVFSLLLADDAKEWWISEGDGKIPLGRNLLRNSSVDSISNHTMERMKCWKGENWGIDPLEFLSNVNTSFKNHKKVDGRTQKESKYENPSNTATNSFFKAYDVRSIEKENGHGQIKRKDNDKDDKRPHKNICTTEKFKAIKYSLGPNEEYFAIWRCEYDIWEINKDSLSQIYK
uniref:CCHC-type domain-containing protein n=1 Tax=Tanacetum cinerariifolium TaxID=118510 RepID=A0A6L2LAQ6_TANCI|nr:hypothetical protein [Tanacetum cinerariifolium]